MESIENTYNGNPDWGRKITCTIARNGDLIQRVYVKIDLPAVTVDAGQSFRWLDYIGLRLLKTVEIEIGGSRIDKHYSEWMHIWAQLTQKGDKFVGFQELVGHKPHLTSITKAGTTATTVPAAELWVPLEFWFCRNPGLALPLIALQYHEVKINIEIANKEDCYWSSKGSAQVIDKPNFTVFVDYYFLDNDERRRFAQSAHEYLIDQLQFSGPESYSGNNANIKMNFNHPVKELVWTVQRNTLVDSASANDYKGIQWCNYSDDFDVRHKITDSILTQGNVGVGSSSPNQFNNFNYMMAAYVDSRVQPNSVGIVGSNPVSKARIQLNGHERFSKRGGVYFNVLQPWAHHDTDVAVGINVFSFAIKPEDYQPSGTCNMSRIDTAIMNLELSQKAQNQSVNVNVYAVNYNVLRIMSGMGGLAYAN